MQSTVQSKLLALRDKRKRWTTRLTRATNMLAKLARQEARLLKSMASVSDTVAGMTAKPGELTPNQKAAIETNAELVQAVFDQVSELASPTEALDIPKVIDRRDPKVKAELEAAREAKKKEMPKNEREALAYIKKRSAKITAKREKRDRAFVTAK